MRSNCVAVLDIRSSELVAVVGERGVNNTFIIKSKFNVAYGGYGEGDFLDASDFIAAATEAVGNVLASAGNIKTFFVGVPGEFLALETNEKIISFPSAKRINKNDKAALSELANVGVSNGWSKVRESCLYYVLSDKRKVIQPVGAVSDSLQGKFCFFKCKNIFANYLKEVFKKFPRVAAIKLLPLPFAEAMYLIEPEKRDECAVLFDLGYISSTYSVVCGNGLLYSKSFSLGIGHIAYWLSDEFEIPFDVAATFLSTVNLNAVEKLSTTEECIYEGETYRFPTISLRDKIREGLDLICQLIEECRQEFKAKSLEGKPLLITGEGVKTVRGAVDHLSGRLVKPVEIVVPRVPYYDKPQFSSTLSLLDLALSDSLAK